VLGRQQQGRPQASLARKLRPALGAFAHVALDLPACAALAVPLTIPGSSSQAFWCSF